MRKPTITIFSALGEKTFTSEQIQALIAAGITEFQSNIAPLSDSELINRCESAEIIGLTRRTCKNLNQRIIHGLPKLKGLAVYATGEEWIDLKTLKRHGVRVLSIPDYSMQTVAEHTVGMILTMTRRIHLSDRVSQYQLPHTISLRGVELAGKNIGFIGFGRIGQRIAALIQPYQIHIAYSDPEVNHKDYALVEVDTLLTQSDILIITASSTYQQEPILGTEQIQRLKPNAYIINPARPHLVNHLAILEAIKQRRLAGYAVDDKIFSVEQLQEIEAGRILQTGHTAWYSDEAMQRGTDAWVKNIIHLAETIT